MVYQTCKSRLYLNSHERMFLMHLMAASRALYNEALYNVRQHFFQTEGFLRYEENVKLLSKSSVHYRILNASQAQAVIQKVDEAMKAFKGSLASKVKHKVRLPRYLKKGELFPLVDRAVYKPQRNNYTLPRSNFMKVVSKFFASTHQALEKLGFDVLQCPALQVKLPTPSGISNKKIKEITIVPKYDGKYLYVCYVYECEEMKTQTSAKTETMGIDLGYNNLSVCAVTTNKHLLVDGLRLKSMNQFYHKQIAYYAAKRDNQKILTKRMMKLMEKRNNQMNYGINKAARVIVTHAVEENVGRIVIGYNENFKNESLSAKYNQWTKSIPLARFRDRIIALATEAGIEVITTNEAYTSKASYIDQDEVKKGTFSGKRIKRGMYQSRNGHVINADLNAALNIMSKSNPDAERIGTKGWNTPKRTYLFE